MNALLVMLATGCSSPPDPGAGRVRFLRDAILLEGLPDAPGRPIGGGRVLLERPWRPGEALELPGAGRVEPPERAECVPLFSVDLGDVSRTVLAGGAAPDTALAFDPAGERLAVGSARGELLVLDAWSGEVLARRRLPEARVRALAWSASGERLYAAEQSPDALLHALDPADLSDRWTLALADRVGRSPMPPEEDLYGVYTLPAGYGLDVLPDGSLVVAATHGWNDARGVRRNQGQLLVVGPDGAVRSSWPDTPAEVTLWHPRVDGDLVVVPVGRSAEGPPPSGLPVGGVEVLRLPALEPVAGIVVEPLAPWFSSAFVWEAVDVDAAAGEILLGLGDGRLRLVDLRGELRWERRSGAPVMAGDVPIVASIGFGFLAPGVAAAITSGTNIPFGAAAPELRPPSAHPGENTLWVHRRDGSLAWTWHGPHELAGITPAPGGRAWVVGAGPRRSDHRADLFGALVFDARDPASDRPGWSRLTVFCATEGPVFFRQAATADGRIAVAETPWVDGAGELRAAYRVTVLR